MTPSNKPNPHSVFDEPHMRSATLAVDPSEAKASLALRRSRHLDDPQDELAEHSVWDETTTQHSAALTGAPPHDAITYGRWMLQRRAQTPAWQSWFVTACLVAMAGPFAVVGTLLTGNVQGLSMGILATVLAAPLVEELLKMSGAAIIIERRIFLFRSPAQIMLTTASAGALFAVIENLLYLNLYIPDPSPAIIAWRWSVCVALHVCCASISGVGLVRVWREAWAEQRRPNIQRATPFFITAIVIHALYNLAAVIFGALGYV